MNVDDKKIDSPTNDSPIEGIQERLVCSISLPIDEFKTEPKPKQEIAIKEAKEKAVEVDDSNADTKGDVDGSKGSSMSDIAPTTDSSKNQIICEATEKLGTTGEQLPEKHVSKGDEHKINEDDTAKVSTFVEDTENVVPTEQPLKNYEKEVTDQNQIEKAVDSQSDTGNKLEAPLLSSAIETNNADKEGSDFIKDEAKEDTIIGEKELELSKKSPSNLIKKVEESFKKDVEQSTSKAHSSSSPQPQIELPKEQDDEGSVPKDYFEDSLSALLELQKQVTRIDSMVDESPPRTSKDSKVNINQSLPKNEEDTQNEVEKECVLKSDAIREPTDDATVQLDIIGAGHEAKETLSNAFDQNVESQSNDTETKKDLQGTEEVSSASEKGGTREDKVKLLNQKDISVDSEEVKSLENILQTSLGQSEKPNIDVEKVVQAAGKATFDEGKEQVQPILVIKKESSDEDNELVPLSTRIKDLQSSRGRGRQRGMSRKIVAHKRSAFVSKELVVRLEKMAFKQLETTTKSSRYKGPGQNKSSVKKRAMSKKSEEDSSTKLRTHESKIKTAKTSSTEKPVENTTSKVPAADQSDAKAENTTSKVPATDQSDAKAENTTSKVPATDQSDAKAELDNSSCSLTATDKNMSDMSTSVARETATSLSGELSVELDSTKSTTKSTQNSDLSSSDKTATLDKDVGGSNKTEVLVVSITGEKQVKENLVNLVPLTEPSKLLEITPHINRPFFCEVCSLSFLCLRRYWNHKNLLHHDHDFECVLCDKKFTKTSALVHHNKFRHKESSENAEMENGKPLFYCEACGEGFRNIQKKISHIQDDHQNGYACCSMCSHASSSIDDLVFHAKEHKKLKNTLFSCRVCGQNVFFLHMFINHLYGHQDVTSPKMFYCKICRSKIEGFKSFRVHMQGHIVTTPKYYCFMCEKVFLSNKKLEIHTKYQHQKYYSGHQQFLQLKSGNLSTGKNCYWCGRVVPKERFKLHLKRHKKFLMRRTQLITCKVCLKGVAKFTLKTHLSKHKKEAKNKIKKIKNGKENDKTVIVKNLYINLTKTKMPVDPDVIEEKPEIKTVDLTSDAPKDSKSIKVLEKQVAEVTDKSETEEPKAKSDTIFKKPAVPLPKAKSITAGASTKVKIQEALKTETVVETKSLGTYKIPKKSDVQPVIDKSMINMPERKFDLTGTAEAFKKVDTILANTVDEKIQTPEVKKGDSSVVKKDDIKISEDDKGKKGVKKSRFSPIIERTTLNFIPPKKNLQRLPWVPGKGSNTPPSGPSPGGSFPRRPPPGIHLGPGGHPPMGPGPRGPPPMGPRIGGHPPMGPGPRGHPPMGPGPRGHPPMGPGPGGHPAMGPGPAGHPPRGPGIHPPGIHPPMGPGPNQFFHPEPAFGPPGVDGPPGMDMNQGGFRGPLPPNSLPYFEPPLNQPMPMYPQQNMESGIAQEQFFNHPAYLNQFQHMQGGSFPNQFVFNEQNMAMYQQFPQGDFNAQYMPQWQGQQMISQGNEVPPIVPPSFTIPPPEVVKQPVLSTQCSGCQKTFPNAKVVGVHEIFCIKLVDKLSKLTKHDCPVCTKKFVNLAVIKQHMFLSHAQIFKDFNLISGKDKNANKHECKTCKQVFGNKEDLKAHEKTHEFLQSLKSDLAKVHASATVVGKPTTRIVTDTKTAVKDTPKKQNRFDILPPLPKNKPPQAKNVSKAETITSRDVPDLKSGSTAKRPEPKTKTKYDRFDVPPSKDSKSQTSQGFRIPEKSKITPASQSLIQQKLNETLKKTQKIEDAKLAEQTRLLETMKSPSFKKNLEQQKKKLKINLLYFQKQKLEQEKQAKGLEMLKAEQELQRIQQELLESQKTAESDYFDTIDLTEPPKSNTEKKLGTGYSKINESPRKARSRTRSPVKRNQPQPSSKDRGRRTNTKRSRSRSREGRSSDSRDRKPTSSSIERGRSKERGRIPDKKKPEQKVVSLEHSRTTRRSSRSRSRSRDRRSPRTSRRRSRSISPRASRRKSRSNSMDRLTGKLQGKLIEQPRPGFPERKSSTVSSHKAGPEPGAYRCQKCATLFTNYRDFIVHKDLHEGSSEDEENYLTLLDPPPPPMITSNLKPRNVSKSIYNPFPKDDKSSSSSSDDDRPNTDYYNVERKKEAIKQAGAGPSFLQRGQVAGQFAHRTFSAPQYRQKESTTISSMPSSSGASQMVTSYAHLKQQSKYAPRVKCRVCSQEFLNQEYLDYHACPGPF